MSNFVEPEQRERLNELWALHMEYYLTTAHRTDCPCGLYLVKRKDVLLPAIVKAADESNADLTEFFIEFANRLHNKHLKEN
jgi:hypothetical protein